MKCYVCLGDHDPDDACPPVKKEVKHGTVEIGPVFGARYNTQCEDCGDNVYPGDRIRKGPDGYIHEGCA